MTNRHWSSKYTCYVDGTSIWVRADQVAKTRPAMVTAGHTETGKTLVTGGKTYYEFLMGGA